VRVCTAAECQRFRRRRFVTPMILLRGFAPLSTAEIEGGYIHRRFATNMAERAISLREGSRHAATPSARLPRPLCCRMLAVPAAPHSVAPAYGHFPPHPRGARRLCSHCKVLATAASA